VLWRVSPILVDEVRDGVTPGTFSVVGAEDAEDLARPDRKTDVVDGEQRTVASR
jgi:hypothetical protein